MKQWGCFALLVLLAVSSQAATFTFIATGPEAPGLSPLNENPPHPTSSATGTALITWDTTTTMMTVNVIFSGLTTPDIMAHIHCCTTTPAGNAGVATTVPAFPGFPLGVTSGTYAHTLDMLNAGSYNPAFVTAHGGTPSSAAAALLTGILAGQTYVNIHTTMFPGGEIRGNLSIPVDISIKPGATPPVPINAGSRGKTPVAIISTSTFNAVTSLDATSLTFGRTGKEPSLAFCNAGGEDVNGDGLLDLVCHFQTELTGFQSGDVLGILVGKTVQGATIVGQEAIVIVP
jgi:CHRD domain-containing protein